MLNELLRVYGQVAAVHPRDQVAWVPCDNDLKPQTILYDGERFWLVDWEAAFQNDRHHDLAVVANVSQRMSSNPQSMNCLRR